MTKLKSRFLSDKRGASYAISAVIITSTIIVLVLVSSMYAYQFLEQRKAMAEFEVAKESILAFDDALENVARTGREAGRSARFTIEYGYLELLRDAKTLNVTAKVGDSNITLYDGSSGFLKYYIENKYVGFGEGYKTYILGDNKGVVNTADSFGRAFIEEQSGLVSITLDYRVRAMKTSVINVTEGDPPMEIRANIVDIWIIKIDVTNPSSLAHDFDLKAKCTNVETTSTPYVVDDDVDNCTIGVVMRGSAVESSSVSISLDDPEKILFNVIVTEVVVTA